MARRPGRKVESKGTEKSKVKGDESKRKNREQSLSFPLRFICFCQSIAIHSGLELSTFFFSPPEEILLHREIPCFGRSCISV